MVKLVGHARELRNSLNYLKVRFPTEFVLFITAMIQKCVCLNKSFRKINSSFVTGIYHDPIREVFFCFLVCDRLTTNVVLIKLQSLHTRKNLQKIHQNETCI